MRAFGTNCQRRETFIGLVAASWDLERFPEATLMVQQALKSSSALVADLGYHGRPCEEHQ